MAKKGDKDELPPMKDEKDQQKTDNQQAEEFRRGAAEQTAKK